MGVQCKCKEMWGDGNEYVKGLQTKTLGKKDLNNFVKQLIKINYESIL
jgi:hypothetical protein